MFLLLLFKFLRLESLLLNGKKELPVSENNIFFFCKISTWSFHFSVNELFPKQLHIPNNYILSKLLFWWKMFADYCYCNYDQKTSSPSDWTDDEYSKEFTLDCMCTSVFLLLANSRHIIIIIIHISFLKFTPLWIWKKIEWILVSCLIDF
jgi:hypothetical protein